MSAQPKHNYTNNPDEKYARWRRRDHANIEAMQNLIFDHVAVESGVEFKPRLRSFISALQSAHGGGEVINEPFERGHKTVASYMQFGGTDEAKAARVRRLINELEDFQDRAGFRFFWITRGGNPTGQFDAHGNELYSATEYIDVLKAIADEAVMRARASDEWKGIKAQGIKAHPGLALAAQVSWAVSQLPKINVQTDTATKAETKPLTTAEYRDMRRPRIVAAIESYADGIEERGGDDEMELEWLEVEVKRIRESRVRTRSTRHDRSPLLAVDAAANGKASTSYKTDLSAELHTAVGTGAHLEVPRGGGVTKMSPLLDVTTNENSELENTADTTMLNAALDAARQGIPVFPLYDVFDGICSCRCSPKKCKGGVHKCGSECANKGKHPRTRNGLIDATMDETQIREWWARWPLANIGAAMGGTLRLAALDFDPRHGGSASFTDLVEAHGDEWVESRLR